MNHKNSHQTILVFDIDGVITHRHQPEVVDSILEQINLCCLNDFKIYFNTGRSQEFCLTKLFPKLEKYPDILIQNPVAMCEKGVVKVKYTNGKTIEQIDTKFSILDYENQILHNTDLDYKSFFRDKTKVSMLSFEKFPESSYAEFEAEILELLEKIKFNIDNFGLNNKLSHDKTKISLDIQHIQAGKDLGAKEIISEVENFISTEERANTRVYTFGDSPSDYAMAKHFKQAGFVVTHVDVGENKEIAKSHGFRIINLKNTFEDGTLGFLAGIIEAHLS